MVVDNSDSGRRLLELFRRIYVVNLPSRPDRRAEAAQQLARIGLSFDHPQVELFDAVRPNSRGEFVSIGARGCFLSHLGVIDAALADGCGSFLILEDDADFAPGFRGRLGGIAGQIDAAGWDIFFGWYPDVPGRPDGDVRDLISPIQPDMQIVCSHFVAFRREAALLARPYLQAIYDRPEGHPDGGAMHVDAAYNWFRRTHPTLRTYAPLQPLAFQRSSRTDIHDLRWFDRIGVVRPIADLARRGRRYLAGRSAGDLL